MRTRQQNRSSSSLAFEGMAAMGMVTAPDGDARTGERIIGSLVDAQALGDRVVAEAKAMRAL